MQLRFQRLLGMAVFVLATLGATSALVAAGLNEEPASAPTSTGR